VILGRVLPGAREIARHEAYHAAALCLAGLVPKCVRTDSEELERVEVLTADDLKALMEPDREAA
jgi:hypothetical protein